MKRIDYRVALLFRLIVISSLSCSSPGLGESNAEYLLSPHVGAQYLSGLSDDSVLDDDDYLYVVEST